MRWQVERSVRRRRAENLPWRGAAEDERRAEEMPVRRADGGDMGQVGKEIASTSRPTPGRVGAPCRSVAFFNCNVLSQSQSTCLVVSEKKNAGVVRACNMHRLDLISYICL